MPTLRAICAPLAGIAALTCVGGGVAQSEPFTIDGKSAESVFKRPHLAELAEAACEGDAGGVRHAIELGADPNGLSEDGGPPLLWAVYCNNPNGVDALLSVGADPNVKALGKYSPTFAATTASNPAVLRKLLSQRGDPNADDGRDSALIMAAEYGPSKGRWENYYSLLNAHADINRLDSADETVAEVLAALNAFDKVAELLELGYDQDLVWLGGHTQFPLAPSSPQAAWREKVKEMLAAKGVKFPIPPLVKLYAGRVWMANDRSLKVVWFGGRKSDGVIVEAWSQVLNPGDLTYDALLKRVGAVKPGYRVGIPRLPDDPQPLGVFPKGD
jgi:hypothetical protein